MGASNEEPASRDWAAPGAGRVCASLCARHPPARALADSHFRWEIVGGASRPHSGTLKGCKGRGEGGGKGDSEGIWYKGLSAKIRSCFSAMAGAGQGPAAFAWL